MVHYTYNKIMKYRIVKGIHVGMYFVIVYGKQLEET